MLAPGTTIDRYSIEGQLGEGGMGVVYAAHDMRLNQTVALKVLRIGDEARRGLNAAAARLLREARTVAAFSHPNAVTIFDVDEYEGSPYIAMERVAGKTLRTFAGVVEVPWQRKVRWLADVGRVLAAAHRSGIVHRDVKLDNVMVRDDGGVKVLDFGIARRVVKPPAAPAPAPAGEPAASNTERDSDPSVHLPKNLMGSPMYIAPEQYDGHPPTGLADQFSWAVMSYWLLSGKSPWGDARVLSQVLVVLLAGTVPPLETLVTGLPLGVAEVIARGLRQNPADRFGTMDEAVDALEKAAEPVPAAPPPAPATTPVPASRGRARTLLALGLGLVLGAGLTLLAGAARQSSTTVMVGHGPRAGHGCSAAPGRPVEGQSEAR